MFTYFTEDPSGSSFFIHTVVVNILMLMTPRDIVNDTIGWSTDIALKNHCTKVLEDYLEEEPALTEQQLKDSLTEYLMGLE